MSDVRDPKLLDRGMIDGIKEIPTKPIVPEICNSQLATREKADVDGSETMGGLVVALLFFSFFRLFDFPLFLSVMFPRGNDLPRLCTPSSVDVKKRKEKERKKEANKITLRYQELTATGGPWGCCEELDRDRTESERMKLAYGPNAVGGSTRAGE